MTLLGPVTRPPEAPCEGRRPQPSPGVAILQRGFCLSGALPYGPGDKQGWWEASGRNGGSLYPVLATPPPRTG